MKSVNLMTLVFELPEGIDSTEAERILRKSRVCGLIGAGRKDRIAVMVEDLSHQENMKTIETFQKEFEKLIPGIQLIEVTQE